MTEEQIELEQSDSAADMGMSAEKAKDTKGTSLRLLRCLRPQRGKLFIVIAAAILGCMLTMAAPLIIGMAIDIKIGRAHV